MSLTLFPAIDLKDGQCVRLRRGEMAAATVYAEDPAAQARAWAAAGFAWLHVVDLNGAFAGRSVNGDAVRAILAAVRIPVQLGGGIRDLAAIETWLAAGVRRVILGSVAARDPGLVRDACRRFPGRIVVGIDARDGMLGGVNLEQTLALARLVSVPVIASGGVAGLDDLVALRAAAPGTSLAGVVVGRALYDGRLDPAAALAALR